MIYFIRDSLSGHIKIGVSDKPWTRLAKMQSDCPGELAILAIDEGGEADERELHVRFAAQRVRGEWYRTSAALLAHIEALPPIKKPRRGPHVWGESGLTDDALAPLVGVGRPQVNRIRRGISIPSLPVAVKIAEVTGVSLASLMGPQPTMRAA